MNKGFNPRAKHHTHPSLKIKFPFMLEVYISNIISIRLSEPGGGGEKTGREDQGSECAVFYGQTQCLMPLKEGLPAPSSCCDLILENQALPR